MLGLLRKLALYGPVTIEAGHRRWWVACQVILPDKSTRGMVKTSGNKLYYTLKDLISKANTERQRLLRELRSPKQQAFQYGVKTGWREIV